MFQASFFATQVQQQRITDTVWSTGPRICKDDKALCGSLGCKLFRSSWRTITATAYEYVIYRCCTTAMEHGALDISLFAVGLPEKSEEQLQQRFDWMIHCGPLGSNIRYWIAMCSTECGPMGSKVLSLLCFNCLHAAHWAAVWNIGLVLYSLLHWNNSSLYIDIGIDIDIDIFICYFFIFLYHW